MYKIKFSYNVGNNGGVFVKNVSPNEDLQIVLNDILDVKGLDSVELYLNGHKCTLPDWYEETVKIIRRN